jgi:hypothetical protein
MPAANGSTLLPGPPCNGARYATASTKRVRHASFWVPPRLYARSAAFEAPRLSRHVYALICRGPVTAGTGMHKPI